MKERKELIGTVVSDKADKTITVKVETYKKDSKYHKRIKYSKKYAAHDEKNVASVGDTVRKHGGKIHGMEDVMRWKNPRLRESPYAVSGERLFKIMTMMASYYNIEWQFCDKGHTGKKIIELLEGDSG